MTQAPSQPAPPGAATFPGTCIRCGVIDSWAKLYLVLWLAEHRGSRLTCRELSEALYLGDEGLVKTMLLELRVAGIVVEVDGRCALSEDPEIQACLRCLQQAYADPLARLDLIDRIRAAGSAVEDYTDGLGRT